MVEHPILVEQLDGSLLISDRTSIRPRHDWRFIGWLLVGAAAALILSDVRALRFVQSPIEYLPPLLTAIVGVVLIKSGQRAQPFLRPLLKIDASRAWVERPVAEGRIERFDTEHLTHVVFGMIDYPWPGREEVKVEAFALYLSTSDGHPIPVVDGSFDKLATYQLGLVLSEQLGLPLIELGKGHPREGRRSDSEPDRLSLDMRRDGRIFSEVS